MRTLDRRYELRVDGRWYDNATGRHVSAATAEQYRPDMQRVGVAEGRRAAPAAADSRRESGK